MSEPRVDGMHVLLELRNPVNGRWQIVCAADQGGPPEWLGTSQNEEYWFGWLDADSSPGVWQGPERLQRAELSLGQPFETVVTHSLGIANRLRFRLVDPRSWGMEPNDAPPTAVVAAAGIHRPGALCHCSHRRHPELPYVCSGHLVRFGIEIWLAAMNEDEPGIALCLACADAWPEGLLRMADMNARSPLGATVDRERDE